LIVIFIKKLINPIDQPGKLSTMQPSEAITMLEPAGWVNSAPQAWADLGCGKGIFTVALASLLPTGSTFSAIDRDADNLHFVPAKYKGTNIQAVHADFTTDLSLSPFDGIFDGQFAALCKRPQRFWRVALFVAEKKRAPPGSRI
jgi:phospholipid N-methyltransferase